MKTTQPKDQASKLREMAGKAPRTFDDSCVYLSGDDKAAIYDALADAIRKAQRPAPPWTDERRMLVGRLTMLRESIAAKAPAEGEAAS
jgi:hypothetical protein